MAKVKDLMTKVVRGELSNDDILSLVELLKGKNSAQRNEFLNKLGIEVANDSNADPMISTNKISDLALHKLVKGLLKFHANDIVEDNTFLRRDDGYCGFLRKLLAEEGKRNPLEEDDIVPDVIIDHFKTILETSPKALDSVHDINITNIANTISFNCYSKNFQPQAVNRTDLLAKLKTGYNLQLTNIKEQDSNFGNDQNGQGMLIESLSQSFQIEEEEVVASSPVKKSFIKKVAGAMCKAPTKIYDAVFYVSSLAHSVICKVFKAKPQADIDYYTQDYQDASEFECSKTILDDDVCSRSFSMVLAGDAYDTVDSVASAAAA